jgi:hypothetical protein
VRDDDRALAQPRARAHAHLPADGVDPALRAEHDARAKDHARAAGDPHARAAPHAHVARDPQAPA